jgi:lambda family phage tail tape measure protein
MANMIARLGVLLGLDSAEFNKGIADAGRKLEQFSNAAVTYGNIAATALTAASYAALKYADELADVAKANDVAIDTVLKLSNALENSGGKAEDSGKLLAGFTKFIDTAAEGSFEAQKHLSQLGVSLKDVGNLSTEEIFNKTVTNLAAIEDPLTRNARAMEIFGKAAKGVDFVGLAEEMQNATTITFEQAKAIQDAADMHDLLAQRARNTMLTLATELGPVLKTTIGYIQDMTSEGNLLGQTFKTVFQTIAIVGANVAFVLKTIVAEVVALSEFADNLVNKNLATATAKYSEYFAKTLEERKKLDEFEKRIMNPDNGMGRFDIGSGDGWDSPKNGPKRLTKVGVDTEALKAERERLRIRKLINDERIAAAKIEFNNQQQAANELTNYVNRNNEAKRALTVAENIFNIERANRDLRSEDVKLLTDLAEIEANRAKATYDIQRNNLLEVNAKDLLIQRETELADQASRLARIRNEAIKADRAGTFEEGFQKSMNKFVRDLPTELENGQKAFDSVIGNMDAAITNFVRTGKLSFKDLARSIIQDIIAIQMKAQASGMLSMLINSMGFGGAQPGTTLSQADYAKISGFADGGDPPIGRISMVGENGPELFVPKTAGTIIPNHALSGMGGTTNVTNNYINAIDTKSFEDRLLGSSTAVWAANQYAGKSMPTNFGRT